MTLDILIRGGQVYDGTGSSWFHADVGVEGDQLLVLRGDTSQFSAGRVIEAERLAVAPGFIDMHAHSAMAILADPRHEAKIRQGVTTELIGVDGNSYAPFKSVDDLEDWSIFNGGLDGTKPHGKKWGSVADYLALYDRSVPVNVAYVIGNSALRIAAVGWDDREVSAEALEEQKKLLAQGLEEGAFGISTGLTYVPGAFAQADELAALCQVVAGYGGVHVSHVRYGSGPAFVDPFREVLALSDRTGVALHISHYASLSKKNGEFNALLGLIAESRENGIDVSFDAYPYCAGGSRATVALPDWIEEGGLAAVKEHLHSSQSRSRMREETDPRQSRWRIPDGWHLTGFTSPAHRELDGLTLDQVAEAVDADPLDALCDLLLAEDLALSYVGHSSNNHVTVRKIMEHPLCAVGSDGLLVGDNPSPRTYGTFPKVLGDLVREEELMELEEAIRKMTSFPARVLGLSDRGIIRDGARADIVIFDPATVGSRATIAEPRCFPEGIPYVIVNGEPVIDAGKHTGATPGRALTRS